MSGPVLPRIFPVSPPPRRMPPPSDIFARPP